MKAPVSLLAVLLMLSSAALGQTAPVQQTTPAPSTPSPAPATSTASTETGGAGDVAAVPVVSLAPPFGAGAKIFVEPMDGFGQLLSEAILKKKVPVVVVKERANADFILSGDAHLKKRGVLTGIVLSTHGKGNIAIKDARTGNQVFAYSFHRVDSMTAEGQLYENWADGCAKHLKKALEKKK